MAGSNSASGSHCQIHQELDMNRPTSSKPALLSKAGGPAASAPGLVSPLTSRIGKVVLSPKSEWGVIASEPTTVAELYAGYVIPLALPAAVVGFLRTQSGLTSLRLFICALFGVCIVGLFINVLAPTFSGRRDPRQALKVAAYSLTPVSLSSVLALAPPILAIPLQLLAGFYGSYVLHLGLPVLMRSTREKAFGYSASVAICTVLVGAVFAVLCTVFAGVQPK
jgi:hypothetical protein